MSRRALSPQDVPATFIACRAFRHEPRFVTDKPVTKRGRVIEFTRITECDVCQTRIRTTYSVPDFRVKKRRYDYPDQYQVKGGFPIYDARAVYVSQRFR